MSAAALVGVLETLDVAGMRRVHAAAFPHLPPLGSDAQVLATMHIARTCSETMAFRHRAYSHAWLVERGYPSQLPDALRPKAEQMHPREVKAVGLSVNFKAPELKPAGTLIRKAGEDVIENAAADGRIADTDYVKPRMLEAMARERRALFGRWGAN